MSVFVRSRSRRAGAVAAVIAAVIVPVGACGFGCSRKEQPPGLTSAVSTGTGRAREVHGGRLREVNGCPVLELWGTPEEMGAAHGLLLGDVVRRVIRDVLAPSEDSRRWREIRAGAEVMERRQPERFRAEMRALAQAAGVEYMEVVALQLFGDAARASGTASGEGAVPPGQQCTTYAVFGPATATGECIVGRNFDYGYTSVAKYASLVVHYRPDGRHALVTISWAGVVNGWTLMNDAGLVAANNTVLAADESLEGISTCFLQRLIVEDCATVAEAVALVEAASRAVGTAMLVAGGEPPDAAEMEFDHSAFAVRRAHAGYVLAANGFRALGRAAPLAPDARGLRSGRYEKLLDLILANHGRIDRSMNFAAAPDVAIAHINLHSALLFPKNLSFAVSMGPGYSCRGEYLHIRMTPSGLQTAE